MVGVEIGGRIRPNTYNMDMNKTPQNAFEQALIDGLTALRGARAHSLATWTGASLPYVRRTLTKLRKDNLVLVSSCRVHVEGAPDFGHQVQIWRANNGQAVTYHNDAALHLATVEALLAHRTNGWSIDGLRVTRAHHERHVLVKLTEHDIALCAEHGEINKFGICTRPVVNCQEHRIDWWKGELSRQLITNAANLTIYVLPELVDNVLAAAAHFKLNMVTGMREEGQPNGHWYSLGAERIHIHTLASRPFEGGTDPIITTDMAPLDMRGVPTDLRTWVAA